MATKKKTNKKDIILPDHLGIYVRVSTDKQAEFGISKQDQIKRGIEVAQKLNWSFEIFEDAGISGMKTFKERPGLNALVEKINLGEIGGIYITDIDRLTREVTNGSYLLTFFKDNKIKIFSIQREIDLQNETDLFQSNLSIVFANFERNKMATRISRALERNALDGKVAGGPMQPYGFKKDLDKKLIIDENEAEIIKMIFKMSLDNRGTKVIANTLNDMGVPTKRGSVKNGHTTVRGIIKKTFKWRDAVVYNILTNPLYKGERHYKQHVLSVPAIISEVQFNAVQENLKTKNRFKEIKDGHFYLLKGLIKCGGDDCKGSFYGRLRSDLKDQQYTCISQRNKSEWCGNRGISIQTLDNLVWELVTRLPLEVEQFFNRIDKIDIYQQHAMGAAKARDKEKETLARMDKLIELSDHMSKDQFGERFGKLEIELNEARKDKKLNVQRMRIKDEKRNILDFVNGLLAPSYNSTFTKEEKQKIIRAFVERIYVTWNPAKSHHWIFIDYKIDKLAQVKLASEMEVIYDKRGWRYDKKSIVNNGLKIRQIWGQDIFEGKDPSRTHVDYF